MGFIKSAVLVLIVAIAINLLPRFFVSTPGASMDGFVAPGYQKVADVFRKNLESGLEKGAAFSVFHNGEMVVNLVGGYADEEASVPWEKDTLTILCSVSKGLGAISIAMLVDRGLMNYNKPVADYWPEFGQNGKQDILVKHLVSHQAGLEVVDGPLEFQWLVTDPSNAKLSPMLAAQKARGKPGSGQLGYHTLTYGLYVDELLRRVDPKHRTMQQFIRDEIADTIGLDLFLGLPKEEHYRTARLQDYYSTNIMRQIKYLYSIYSDPVQLKVIKQFAFETDSLGQRSILPESDFSKLGISMNSPSFQRIPCSSVSGYATATALAQLYGTLAVGGTEPSKDVKLMSRRTAKKLMSHLVYGEEACFGIPMNLTHGLYASTNPMGGEIFGSIGMGGQMAWADTNNKLGWAYVTNHFTEKSDNMDERYTSLYEALYDVVQRK